MPTAARLVAMFCLALLGWYVAGIVHRNIPAAQESGVWYTGFAAVGAVFGWNQLGLKVGHPLHKSFFAGMGAVISCFIALVVLATLFAAYDAMGYNAYRTINDLMAGLTKNTVGYLSYALDNEIVIVALIGGGLSGLMSEMAHRKWR